MSFSASSAVRRPIKVSVANIIGSLRALGQIDWRESFERLSLVEGILRGDALYTQMDFASRDEYRHEIERLARGVSLGKGESNAANADYAANEIAVARVRSKRRDPMKHRSMRVLSKALSKRRSTLVTISLTTA
jgi:hypothetical protein